MKYKIIIPARGGSKRFPGKNIALLGGIPLIAHTILFCQEINLLNAELWVNTDDVEIEKIAKSYNCNIFKRSNNLGTDFTSTAEVLKEQVESILKTEGEFDAVILLQVTNPLRLKSTLLDAIEQFESSGRTSLATFSNLNRKIGYIENGFFKPINYFPGQRMQDIKPCYYENGSIYISKVSEILKGNVIGDDVLTYIDNDEFSSIDIDEKNDLIFAEYIFEKFKKTL